jgi:hypothetical protein
MTSLSDNETRMYQRFNLGKPQLNYTQSLRKLNCRKRAVVIHQHYCQLQEIEPAFVLDV